MLRAVSRDPASVEAFGAEVAKAGGAHPELGAAIDEVADLPLVAREELAPLAARAMVERLAITLQASLLACYAPSEVADAFIGSRLLGRHGHTFGTLNATVVGRAGEHVIDRAFLG